MTKTVYCVKHVIWGTCSLVKLKWNHEINNSWVRSHINKVDNGKAHQVDGILNEASKNSILSLLTKVYNTIFK